LGKHDVLHLQGQVSGERNAQARVQDDFGLAALVDGKTTTKGQQFQFAAPKTHQGVGLGNALIVEGQSSRPQATDQVPVAQITHTAIGQKKSGIGAHPPRLPGGTAHAGSDLRTLSLGDRTVWGEPQDRRENRISRRKR
jgi:hypothetical protein